MTPDTLDDLAQQMFWPATKLVAAVHDHDTRTSHTVLSTLDTVELRALAVVLASLVPDDHTFTTLARCTRGTPPVSERQAAQHRATLEAELAHAARTRRQAAA
ncbi:hypothetical protein GCM10017559_08100 [Streptosporangium longisporum]|uniref:MarR family transcriptional regulator n=1 Tax=Streptosporangium longisporum TaxID=46187 RepID=A0ABN3XSM7_9ACTN